MSKYGSVKVKADGYTFDSRREYKRYRELLLLQAAGEISNLEVHPHFPWILNGKPIGLKDRIGRLRPMSYTADFRYQDVRTGDAVIEDTKGFDAIHHRIKRAVTQALYDVEIKLI